MRCTLPLLVLAAGCDVVGSYLVDGRTLTALQRPPAVARIGDHLRRVGYTVVEVRCREPSQFLAVVEGPAGRWDVRTDDLAARCDDPAAIDALALRAARRYQHQRGVLAATRVADGVETDVRLSAIDFRSARDGPDGTTVTTRVANESAVASIILAAIGTAIVGLGVWAYFDAASSEARCHQGPPGFNCPIETTMEGLWSLVAMFVGAHAALAGGILGLVAARRRPQEAPPDARDLLYFGY